MAWMINEPFSLSRGQAETAVTLRDHQQDQYLRTTPYSRRAICFRMTVEAATNKWRPRLVVAKITGCFPGLHRGFGGFCNGGVGLCISKLSSLLVHHFSPIFSYPLIDDTLSFLARNRSYRRDPEGTYARRASMG